LISSQSIDAMALAISLFATIPVIYSGFKGVEINQIKLARTFGASKAQILTKVLLPGSIPTMIATLKVNAGLPLVGIVADIRCHRLGREVRHAPAVACRRRFRPANPVAVRFVPVAFGANQDHATNRKQGRYERTT
jgi:ABC-type proline/glycine betaine transport system permease subunit